MTTRMPDEPFSLEQTHYLQGFLSGHDTRRAIQGLPTFAATLGWRPGEAVQGGRDAGDPPARPELVHRQAQDRFLAQGKKLTAEEEAKRKKDPLDLWDELERHGREGRFPKGTDVFLFKFHGLFYVAPAQDAFMCRLRIPAGILHAHQLRSLAAVAERHAGGYADVTSRANLQLREIQPRDALAVLTSIQDLGLHTRGAGADNIRNVTATPTAGIDPQELIDTAPLARELHHYILNHRELYGLPRKFNIAFDGGGTISALEDTNDIGLAAVRVGPGKQAPPGVYFRVLLGGITGHRDFARDTGLLLEPGECIAVAAAIVRVFIEHGDRTDRKKARLKYLLDAWGHEKLLAEAQKRLPFPLRRLPLEDCEPRGPVAKHAHVGVHRQVQAGLCYAGVVLPVGRMTAPQMRGLAAIAERCGSGTLRLTVWQNLLISDIPGERIEEVRRQLGEIGLAADASNIAGCLVACTGSKGCKYAAADTKGHALEIARHLESRVELDQPLNIHLTGCPHSCAQHYLGDIGLLATKVQVGDDLVEGYHVFAGGGYGAERDLGREVARDVPAAALGPVLERLLQAYLAGRTGKESFREFVIRQPTPRLREALAAGASPGVSVSGEAAMPTETSLLPPLLPESAPFTPAQRAWLNGFFAGLLGIDRQGAAGAPDAAPAAAAPAADELPWHDPALDMEERLRLAAGKPLERRLMAAMAQLDCGACGYLCQTYGEALASGAERNLTLCAPGGKATAAKLRELMAARPAAAAFAAPPARSAAPRSLAWDRQNPFPARFVRSIRLNREGSSKDTRQVVIDLEGSGMTYEPGDALGVLPENCPDLVGATLAALGASGEEPVAAPGGGSLRLQEALARHCALEKAPPELLELLGEPTGDDGEEERDVIDVLAAVGRSRPAPAQLVAALQPLRPRLYSIASSLRAHPDEVHLTVGVVRYQSRGRERKGVASTYLAERLAEGSRVKVFVQRSPRFRLPPSGDVPIIMIGPGTGIAPFRAFLEERRATGARGKAWLFFGEQRRDLDFLYQTELEGHLRDGFLSRIDTAFSRDQEAKVYVQHRIHERSRELWAWLESGAHVYVCGDARRMARDVDDALRAIIEREGGLSAGEARQRLGELGASGRYQRDVY